MTTVAASPLRRGASPRPIAWRRMAWVVWRQHGITVAAVIGLFGAASLYLLFRGLQIHNAYAQVTSCHPSGSGLCRQVASVFSVTYSSSAGNASALMQLLPALIGAFVGAPLLARELETGTFRYAWTQGFGRVRWTAANLAPLAVVVAGLAALFSLVYSWCYGPLFSLGDQSPLRATIFDLRGVALAAWTLVGFAVGALAGMVLRRVVPALAVTLAAWTGLSLLTGTFLRQHYEAPLISTNPNLLGSDSVISQWWSHNGQPVSTATLDRALAPFDVQVVGPETFRSHGVAPPNFDPMQYLTHHGYALLSSYQPSDRFWPFQWIEAGWLLALTLALFGAVIWLVRRRAA